MRTENWIEYEIPLEGKTLTDNKFWDRERDAGTPTPTPTATLPSDCQELLTNGDFESGSFEPWGSFGDVDLGAGRDSDYGAWLGGVNDAGGELLQGVPIPAEGSPVWLRFWWLVESAIEQPDDAVEVIVQYDWIWDEQSDHLRTLRAEEPLGQWRQEVVDLTAYAGREIAVTFMVHTDGDAPTTFRLDDVSVQACSATTPTPTGTATATAPLWAPTGRAAGTRSRARRTFSGADLHIDHRLHSPNIAATCSSSSPAPPGPKPSFTYRITPSRSMKLNGPAGPA